VKLGALCWPQYTDWPALLEAGQRADRLGYDSLWTWDHLYPSVGSSRGPIFEGWLVCAGWAAATTRVSVGLLVGANTYRNPAIVAKMATTLDHVSNGRAVLGIGASWFEEEAHAFGFDLGASVGERLDWLGEALPLIRGMLDGTEPSSEGRYRTWGVRNLPAPVQPRLPILVGGEGERKTLRLVARYADMSNFGGDVEYALAKDAVLRHWCQVEGRDQRQIERTIGVGTPFIRDSREEARRVCEAAFARNGGAKPHPGLPVGTPEDVAEQLAPLVDAGFGHLVASFPSPYDEESMTRLATEVRPMIDVAKVVPERR
jgi:alkanesulfonate monooxygenase SsuD/methylene tetrahydromethanopterin reductase-like flavin-dependent oxidoreductase (luciferase family)